MKRLPSLFLIFLLLGAGCRNPLASDRSPEANLDAKFLTVLEQLPDAGCSLTDPVVYSTASNSEQGMVEAQLTVARDKKDDTVYASTPYCYLYFFEEPGSQGAFVAYDLSVHQTSVMGTVVAYRLENDNTTTDVYEEVFATVDFTPLTSHNDFLPHLGTNNTIVYTTLDGQELMTISWNGTTFENK